MDHDVKVSDTLAWSITVLVISFLGVSLLSSIIGLLITFSVYDGYLMYQIGIVLFILFILVAMLIMLIVLKIQKIWRRFK